MLGLWAIGAIVLRVAAVPPERCPAVSTTGALTGARAAAAWMERAQRADGSYLYEYNIEEDREVPGYNAVRHAGVTMALYLLAAGGEPSTIAAGDRGLAWMERNLIRHGDWAALQAPADGSIELGASALLLAGLAQRRQATSDTSRDGLMREVGRFVLTMQNPDGSFLLRWLPETGAPDPTERSKYATGEAFWALTLLRRAFPAEEWERPARAAADYLSLYRDSVEHQKFPPWADQWAAYGLAEMASWPLNDGNIAYARSLAQRFGFLVRVESRRTDSWLSKEVRGRRARAAGMGTWSEALDSLWRLASADERMADMRQKLAERAICAAGMLHDRQFTQAKAATFASPAIAEGAWFTNGATRMDDQQHALAGLLRSAAIINGSTGGGR